MARWTRRFAFLGGGALLLQFGGCSLFDGQALERILLGTLFTPMTDTVFEVFYTLGAGG